jgi:hypothetical protein
MFETWVYAIPGCMGWLLDLVESARESGMEILVFEHIGLYDFGTWAWRDRTMVPSWTLTVPTEVPEDAVATGSDGRILFRTGKRDRQIIGQPEKPLCEDCCEEKAYYRYRDEYLCQKCFRKQFYGMVGEESFYWCEVEGFRPYEEYENGYRI